MHYITFLPSSQLINSSYNTMSQIIYFKPTSLWSILAVFIGVIILSTLGFWQIERLNEKNILLKKIEANLSSEGAITDLITSNELYSKVKVQGKFLINKDIHLYGRRFNASEKDAYNLLTPFRLSSGQVVMVARGWFVASDKGKVETSDDAFQEITGFVLTAPRKSIFMPASDVKNNVWLSIDIKQMQEVLELSLSEFYLLETSSSKIPLLKPLPAKNLLHLKNDHLEYAITWFCLAAILLLGFAWSRVKILEGRISK